MYSAAFAAGGVSLEVRRPGSPTVIGQYSSCKMSNHCTIMVAPLCIVE